jgi:hypothetical protein
MDFISVLRGVNFVPLGTENPADQSLRHDSANKTIETIWERDPGDAPWFDFSLPDFNNPQTLFDFQDNSTQTVMMFDLNNDGVDVSTQTNNTCHEEQDKSVAALCAIAGKVDYILKLQDVNIDPLLFKQQLFILEHEPYTFDKDKIINSRGEVVVLPFKIVFFRKEKVTFLSVKY